MDVANSHTLDEDVGDDAIEFRRTGAAARQTLLPWVVIALAFVWGMDLVYAFLFAGYGKFAPLAVGVVIALGCALSVGLVYLIRAYPKKTRDGAETRAGFRLAFRPTVIELDTFLSRKLVVPFQNIRKLESTVDRNGEIIAIRAAVDHGSFEIWGFESMRTIRDLLLERIPESAEVSETVRFRGTLAAVPWTVRELWIAAGATVIFVALFVIAGYFWPLLVLLSLSSAVLVAFRIGMLPYYWKKRGLYGLKPFYRSVRYTVYVLVILAVVWFLWSQ